MRSSLDPGIVGFFARAEGSLSGELISEPTLYEFASQERQRPWQGFSAVGTRDCGFANVLRARPLTPFRLAAQSEAAAYLQDSRRANSELSCGFSPQEKPHRRVRHRVQHGT